MSDAPIIRKLKELKGQVSNIEEQSKELHNKISVVKLVLFLSVVLFVLGIFIFFNIIDKESMSTERPLEKIEHIDVDDWISKEVLDKNPFLTSNDVLSEDKKLLNSSYIDWENGVVVFNLLEPMPQNSNVADAAKLAELSEKVHKNYKKRILDYDMDRILNLIVFHDATHFIEFPISTQRNIKKVLHNSIYEYGDPKIINFPDGSVLVKFQFGAHLSVLLNSAFYKVLKPYIHTEIKPKVELELPDYSGLIIDLRSFKGVKPSILPKILIKEGGQHAEIFPADLIYNKEFKTYGLLVGYFNNVEDAKVKVGTNPLILKASDILNYIDPVLTQTLAQERLMNLNYTKLFINGKIAFIVSRD